MEVGTRGARIVRSRKEALVVLGMHRSGTSAMARALSLVGGQLPESIMPAAEGNEFGHWEPLEVADMNDRILAALDSDWSDLFGPRRFRHRTLPLDKYIPEMREIIRRNYQEKDLIVLKEPRLSLLLEPWREALILENFNVSFIIMVRRPDEVAASLKKRNNFPESKSIILWATYMLSAENKTRDYNRVFVQFDELIRKPETVIDIIESQLQIIFPRRSWDSAIEIDDFLRPERKNFNFQKEKWTDTHFSEIEKFYGYLDAAAQGEPWNIDIGLDLSNWLDQTEMAVGPILKNLERDLKASKLNEATAYEAVGRLQSDLEIFSHAVEAKAAEDAAELAAANAATKDVQAKLAQRDAELLSLRLASDEARTRAAQSDDELTKAKIAIQDARASAAALEDALSETQDILNAARDSLSATQHQAQIREVELAAHRHRSNELEETLATTQDKLASLQTETQMLGAKVADERLRSAELEQALASALNNQKALEANFADQTIRMRDALSIAERRASEFEQALASALSNQKALEADFDRQALRMRDAQIIAENRAASLEKQLKDISKHQSDEIYKFEQKLALAESAIVNAENQASEFDHSLTTAYNEHAIRERELLNQLTETSNELDSFKSQAAELARTLTQTIRQRDRKATFWGAVFRMGRNGH